MQLLRSEAPLGYTAEYVRKRFLPFQLNTPHPSCYLCNKCDDILEQTYFTNKHMYSCFAAVCSQAPVAIAI